MSTGLQKQDFKPSLEAYAYILENVNLSIGSPELASALINISMLRDQMTENLASRIRHALKNTGITSDREIMDDLKTFRKDFPREDWWWYPERL